MLCIGIVHRKEVYRLIGSEALERIHLSTAFTFASIWLLDYLQVHLLFMFPQSVLAALALGNLKGMLMQFAKYEDCGERISMIV